jgi:hypothetical protein
MPLQSITSCNFDICNWLPEGSIYRPPRLNVGVFAPTVWSSMEWCGKVYKHFALFMLLAGRSDRTYSLL